MKARFNKYVSRFILTSENPSDETLLRNILDEAVEDTESSGIRHYSVLNTTKQRTKKPKNKLTFQRLFFIDGTCPKCGRKE